MQEDTNPSPIQQLLAQIPEKTGSKALESLDPETRELLEAFAVWMEQEDGKSPATAKAYKSYVATALAKMSEGGSWDDLTTDIRSGVNAFVRFSSSIQEELEQDDAEVLEDQDDVPGDTYVAFDEA